MSSKATTRLSTTTNTANAADDDTTTTPGKRKANRTAATKTKSPRTTAAKASPSTNTISFPKKGNSNTTTPREDAANETAILPAGPDAAAAPYDPDDARALVTNLTAILTSVTKATDDLNAGLTTLTHKIKDLEEQVSDLHHNRSKLEEDAEILHTTVSNTGKVLHVAVSDTRKDLPALTEAAASAAAAEAAGATNTLVANTIQDACATAAANSKLTEADVTAIADAISAAILPTINKGPSIAEKISTAAVLKQLHTKLDAYIAGQNVAVTAAAASPQAPMKSTYFTPAAKPQQPLTTIASRQAAPTTTQRPLQRITPTTPTLQRPLERALPTMEDAAIIKALDPQSTSAESALAKITVKDKGLRSVFQIDTPHGQTILRNLHDGKPTPLRQLAVKSFIDAATTSYGITPPLIEDIANALAANAVWDAGLTLGARGLAGWCPICSPGWEALWQNLGLNHPKESADRNNSINPRCMDIKFFASHMASNDTDYLHAGLKAFLTTCHPTTFAQH